MKQLGNRHSQHSFAQTPSVNMARSKFDRSHSVKDTMNFDLLYPIFVDEILPGDTINLNVKSFARLAPQVVPLMDNMYIDWFFFFVPNRLVWENWERFNGAQDDPTDSTDFLIPAINLMNDETYEVGTIYDKMGLPTDVTLLNVNALPFRAYNLIWNEWFRDQNLQDSVTVKKGNGPDAITDYELLPRGKKHDYFTSCLPFLQKGPTVGLQLPDQADIRLNQFAGTPTFDDDYYVPYDTTGNTRHGYGTAPATFTNAFPANTQANLYADTSEFEITINALRQGILVQSLYELDARGGTRYTEILRAHFNVISPDFRLQRPEFLSGGTTHISQHVVPQTSETTDDSPQGNLAAFSTSSNTGSHIGFSKSFVEHGYVIGLCQARADITYQQGLNKLWQRQTRFDFFWPKLQMLGEQAVLNREIYAQGNSVQQDSIPVDSLVFGYQERYAEYRYKPSEIRGQFRSTFAETLDVWHMAEEFEQLPLLNEDFIQSATPIDRSLVLPDPDYPALLMDLWFDYKHARPMMARPVPATLGRF